MAQRLRTVKLDERGPVPEEARNYYRELLRNLDSDDPLSTFERLASSIREEVGKGTLPPTIIEDVAVAVRLRESFDNKRKREKELSALYETARDLSALRDTDQVLHAIVQRARQLVGSDIAYLSAADEERNDFYVKATEGVISQDFARIRVPRHVGVCGSVARTRRPFYSSNYPEDRGFPHDPSIDRATRGEGIVSILGIPLEVDAHVIGVLFVGDRYVRSYTPQEMAVLSSLGTFAALAIENARLLEEARGALQIAKDANAALKAKADAIEDAAVAHEQLTELIARGGTLDDLTKRVAGLLRGQAAVLDDRRKVISGEVSDQVTDEQLARAVRESDRLGRSVQIPCGDGGVALVAAAIGGSARLGTLVFRRQSGFSASEVRTFERSAIVTGIVLLSMERVAQTAHRHTADAVSALVRGTVDPFATGSMRQLPTGVSLSWPITMMLVELADASFMQLAPAARSVLARRDTIFSEFNGDLVAITNAPDPEDLGRKLSEKLRESLGRTFSIVLSAPIPAVEKAPDAYDALRRCVLLLRGLGQQGRVVSERSLSMYALLFNNRGQDAIGSFVQSAIGPIVERDRRRDSQLARTLLAYFDSGRCMQKAADLLGIHVNTVRQRLETISQLDPSLAEPSRCLETHVALRMHALAQAG